MQTILGGIMKFLLIALSLTFGSTAFSAPASEVSPGVVICSMVSPQITGFELVKVRAKDRDYSGKNQISNFQFDGVYRSKDGSFNVNVGLLNEDGEVEEEIFSLKSDLFSGSFLRAKAKLSNQTLEFYCYFVADLK
jgi:hypothetical protein